MSKEDLIVMGDDTKMNCTYCSLINGNEYILNNKNIEVAISEKHMIIFNNNDLTSTSIEINYCPICGEQLNIE